MLLYLIDRIMRCRYVDYLIVATSTDKSDDALVESCIKWKVPCYRGSLTNVARRFKEILDREFPHACLRLNGDSPLLDNALVDHAIGVFWEGEWDLVTNVQIRTYPKGQSVEVIRTEAYLKAFEKMTSEEEWEHVTRHFYLHPHLYRIHNIHSGREYGEIQLSVDTSEDMALIEKVISRMTRPHWEYGLEETLQLREQVLAEARVG